MKNLFFFALMLLTGSVCMTSCLGDDEASNLNIVRWPVSSDGVTTLTVMDNPTKLCVVGDYLFVNGYGSNDWYTPGAMTYPVQLVNPGTLSVTTLTNLRASNMAALDYTLLMSYSETSDWVNYRTEFRQYLSIYGGNETGIGGDFLKGAPDELYASNVYMLSVNPSNRHIYVAATDSRSKSDIYHFNHDGTFLNKIEGCGASVSHAVYAGEDVFLLSEGVWGMNNSTIYKVNAGATVATELYKAANGKLLGDTGNDMIAHNNSIYVVVNGSKYIARLDSKGVESARYACTEDDGAPRSAAAYGDYVYVSTYNGKVLRFDTNLRKCGEKTFNTALEDITVCAGHICVLGTGMGADNRLFVIDPSKF